MKIALVVHDFHRAGGHSRYAVALAEAFAVRHQVHVFANTIDRLTGRSIQFHRVPAWRTSALSTILTFPLFLQLRLRRTFDIVHAQGFSAFGPDVITAHMCHAAWREAREAAGPRSPRERATESILTRIERSVYRQPASVIAVSEKVRNELAQFYGRTQNVRVIHQGVDLEEFSPVSRERLRSEARRRLGLQNDLFTGLYVGDLRKGADRLLNVLARVDRLSLLFVSRSAPGVLLERARALGVEKRLMMCPHTTRIVDYYAAADALLFPTVYDAFGMVISEAMACGLPVITSRSAGATELIENGADGLIIDTPGNVDGFAAAVRDLMSSPERQRRLGIAARARAEAHSWDRVSQETMSVYQEILEKRRRCSR